MAGYHSSEGGVGPFPTLYDLLRQARNSAMHAGATARYATGHAVELTLVLEDALRKSYDKIVLLPADTCRASDPVKSVLEVWKGDAILVTREKTKELLGILTPYDLL